jgi:hypothetical protein
MDPARKDDVARFAAESGVDLALFAGWDGHELGLYRDSGGASRSLEVAQRIAREKALRGDWILDLGNRAFALPAAQGAVLKEKFDAAGVEYSSGSQAQAFLKRTRWAVTEYGDVLAELAKR